MLGTNQPVVMASFYETVFGKKPDMVEGEWSGWSVGVGFFSVGRHSEMKGKSTEPGRIMFTLETEEVQEEYDRMISAGVVSVKAPYEMGDMHIATLADPDGNYFQLMSPWKGQ